MALQNHALHIYYWNGPLMPLSKRNLHLEHTASSSAYAQSKPRTSEPNTSRFPSSLLQFPTSYMSFDRQNLDFPALVFVASARWRRYAGCPSYRRNSDLCLARKRRKPGRPARASAHKLLCHHSILFCGAVIAVISM